MKGFRRADGDETVKATVGKPLTIECPKYTEGVGNAIIWGNLPEGEGIPTMWRMGQGPTKNVFFGPNGELIFQSLSSDEAKLVNDHGGASCILYLGSPEVSKQFKINIGILYKLFFTNL